MAKTLAHKIFRIGRIPPAYKEGLAAEGIVWLEEGVRASITLKDYKAPGRKTSWRRAGFTGSIALTRKRIIAFAHSKRVISVPFNDARITQLEASIENGRCLVCAFDAAAFDSDRSGRVECRFYIERPTRFLEQLNRMAT